MSPMKEHYFTPETSAVTIAELRQQIEHLKKRHAPQFNPISAALLVLDMQEYFLLPESHAYVPSAPTILPNIQRMIRIFAKNQRTIIFTQHLNTLANSGSMGRWWQDLITPDHSLKGISSALDTRCGQILIKTQYDAFLHTNLETILRENNIEQVVISGVMTHLCCESTARSAFMHGFDVFFTIDGTATYRRDFHLATLVNLSHGFAVPVLVDEVLTAFREDSDG